MRTALHVGQRLYLILWMTLTALTGFAQQTGDVIYVYQKDGNILPLLREEIREMSYTIEDTEGLTESEAAMQWIVTADSTYKIPVNDIDSISFVTPATVYQPGVIRIEQGLMDYVESCDSLTFTLSKSVPADLLPKAGDKLVTLEMNDKFPIGFAGKVNTVTDTGTAYTVACDAIDLTELFETYYNVTTAEGAYEEESAARREARARALDINFQPHVNFKLPTYSASFGSELAKNTKPFSSAIKFGSKFEVKIQPTIDAKLSLIVNKERGTLIDVSIVSLFDTQESASFYGGQEKSLYLGWAIAKQPIAPLIFLYFKPGVFSKGEKLASISTVRKQNYTARFSYHFDSKAPDNGKPMFKLTYNKPDFHLEGCLEGRQQIGVFAETGITILHSMLDNLSGRIEEGVELVGKIVVTEDDIKKANLTTGLYDLLNATTVEVNKFHNNSIQWKDPEKTITPLQTTFTKNLYTFNLVPSFSNMEFTESRHGSVSGDATATLTGNCMFPMTVGFVVKDKDGNQVRNWNAQEQYKNQQQVMNATFTGLEEGEKYVLYPKLDFFGWDMLASPATELETSPFPVRIINFEQTDAAYSKTQGYEYDGRNYHYKFNATTTVEIDKEAKNIKDWGYVYHDIYGEDKKLSCANLGSNPYADERYAYYNNKPERTVELSPYVQYEGETEIVVGKKKVFQVKYVYQSVSSCPDENHPHAIDLGLPSGTLWSCCNIGADEPEAYGGYYQFGATSEISASGNYDVDPKAFQSLSNIAGTEYDAAHVVWGADWQMPTIEQFAELLSFNGFDLWANPFDIPTYQWDQNEYFDHPKYGDADAFKVYDDLGGVGCLKLKGPNGNCIVLPCAGSKESQSEFIEPPLGHNEAANKPKYIGTYWSATPGDVHGNDKSEIGRCFDIEWTWGSNVNMLYLNEMYLSVGSSIRPVMKSLGN